MPTHKATANHNDAAIRAVQRELSRTQKAAMMSPAKLKVYTYGPALAITFVVIAALVVTLLLQPAPATDPRADWPPADETLSQHEIEYRYDGDPYAIGDPAAMTTIVMFTDYTCPGCGDFTRDTLPQLEDEIEQSIVRIEFRDTATLDGGASERAARAGFAAAEQGAYIEFHTAMHERPRSFEDMTEEKLLETASTLDLDMEKFRDDMRSDVARAVLETNNAVFEETGFMVHPAAVAGGAVVEGAQPSEIYTDWLDEFKELQ